VFKAFVRDILGIEIEVDNIETEKRFVAAANRPRIGYVDFELDIRNPERPTLNTENEGIKKAMELISFENLTPENRSLSKNREEARIVHSV